MKCKLLIFSVFVVALSSCQNQTPQFTIGQEYQGGYIFYIDASGEHGLICPTYDQAFAIQWAPNNTQTNATNDVYGQGQNNTNLIVNIIGPGYYAAYLCDTLTEEGYTDWFLPTEDELSLMLSNLKLHGLGNFANAGYWSSTELSADFARVVDFGNSTHNNEDKQGYFAVRAVRKF